MPCQYRFGLFHIGQIGPKREKRSSGIPEGVLDPIQNHYTLRQTTSMGPGWDPGPDCHPPCWTFSKTLLHLFPPFISRPEGGPFSGQKSDVLLFCPIFFHSSYLVLRQPDGGPSNAFLYCLQMFADKVLYSTTKTVVGSLPESMTLLRTLLHAFFLPFISRPEGGPF